MERKAIARLKLARKPVRERRSSSRDRRLMEGTMKFRGKFSEIEILDVSSSGALISSQELPDWQDTVAITFCLPESGETVMVTGRVCRFVPASRFQRRQGRIAVRFTRFFSRQGQQALSRHLAA